MNNWGIPIDVEARIRNRDKNCVYCQIRMLDYRHRRGVPKDKATLEHINNNDPRPSLINNAVCCGACNTSKGTKPLLKWFESEYCRKWNINERTVAPVVKRWLREYPRSRR